MCVCFILVLFRCVTSQFFRLQYLVIHKFKWQQSTTAARPNPTCARRVGYGVATVSKID